MLNIKKKIISLSIVCALFAAMTACSDDGGSGTSKIGSKVDVGKIKTPTLSSEEAEELKSVKFSISEFVLPTDVAQDPVEQDNDSTLDGNANNNVGENTADPNNGTPVATTADGQIIPVSEGQAPDSNVGGGNNAQQNTGNQLAAASDPNTVIVDSPNNVIKGTKKSQQAFWMDLNGDYVFDGEFITADFKIKDTTANGTYPILIEKMDLSNIKSETLRATGINGSVVVGGNAVETQFKNDGTLEIKGDSVSGNPGDTVTVVFRIKNNPGLCASVFRFAYDSDALEYVDGSQGEDFFNAIDTQNN